MTNTKVFNIGNTILTISVTTNIDNPFVFLQMKTVDTFNNVSVQECELDFSSRANQTQNGVSLNVYPSKFDSLTIHFNNGKIKTTFEIKKNGEITQAITENIKTNLFQKFLKFITE